jgi:hypothetical protein
MNAPRSTPYNRFGDQHACQKRHCKQRDGMGVEFSQLECVWGDFFAAIPAITAIAVKKPNLPSAFQSVVAPCCSELVTLASLDCAFFSASMRLLCTIRNSNFNSLRIRFPRLSRATEVRVIGEKPKHPRQEEKIQ